MICKRPGGGRWETINVYANKSSSWLAPGKPVYYTCFSTIRSLVRWPSPPLASLTLGRVFGKFPSADPLCNNKLKHSTNHHFPLHFFLNLPEPFADSPPQPQQDQQQQQQEQPIENGEVIVIDENDSFSDPLSGTRLSEICECLHLIFPEDLKLISFLLPPQWM